MGDGDGKKLTDEEDQTARLQLSFLQKSPVAPPAGCSQHDKRKVLRTQIQVHCHLVRVLIFTVFYST